MTKASELIKQEHELSSMVGGSFDQEAHDTFSKIVEEELGLGEPYLKEQAQEHVEVLKPTMTLYDQYLDYGRKASKDLEKLINDKKNSPKKIKLTPADTYRVVTDENGQQRLQKGTPDLIDLNPKISLDKIRTKRISLLSASKDLSRAFNNFKSLFDSQKVVIFRAFPTYVAKMEDYIEQEEKNLKKILENYGIQCQKAKEFVDTYEDSNVK